MDYGKGNWAVPSAVPRGFCPDFFLGPNRVWPRSARRRAVVVRPASFFTPSSIIRSVVSALSLRTV